LRRADRVDCTKPIKRDIIFTMGVKRILTLALRTTTKGHHYTLTPINGISALEIIFCHSFKYPLEG
jgi:hypothetical protein